MIIYISYEINRITSFDQKEVERFLKFAVVGLMGAIIDFGFLYIFRPIFLNLAGQGAFDSMSQLLGDKVLPSSVAIGAASGIAFLFALASNFIWNRYWTYPESRSKTKRLQIVQFAGVNMMGFLVRPVYIIYTREWFGGLVNHFAPSLEIDTAYLIGDNLCQASIIGVIMIWNFFVNRYWTYSDVDMLA